MTRHRDETGADLAETEQALAGYLDTLRTLMPELTAEGGGMPQGVIGRHTASPVPGNAAAFGAYFTIREGIRRLEALQKFLLTGYPGLMRGGSDGNTRQALAQTVRNAAGLSRADARATLRTLARYEHVAQSVPGIDEAEIWRYLLPDPRSPEGTLPPCCPFCRCYQLQVNTPDRKVRCVTWDCEDSRGKRPEARMDRSDIDGRPQLIWDDGLVQEVR